LGGEDVGSLYQSQGVMSTLEERAVIEQMTAFGNAVKLVAFMQATLEQMDTMKGSKLYRHKLKRLMNQLEVELERTVLEPLRKLDSTDEELTTRIQNNIEVVMDMNIVELSALREQVEEYRKDA
jgi:hypothetical protein